MMVALRAGANIERDKYSLEARNQNKEKIRSQYIKSFSPRHRGRGKDLRTSTSELHAIWVQRFIVFPLNPYPSTPAPAKVMSNAKTSQRVGVP